MKPGVSAVGAKTNCKLMRTARRRETRRRETKTGSQSASAAWRRATASAVRRRSGEAVGSAEIADAVSARVEEVEEVEGVEGVEEVEKVEDSPSGRIDLGPGTCGLAT